MSNVLVLNLGLKSVRSIVFDSKGKKIASASRPIETALAGAHVTQSPTEWWLKTIEVISETLPKSNYDIKYITVTASASCLVCVDEKGNELDRAVMVSDKRALNESIELQKKKKFKKVQEITGLGSDSYLMIPKIIWYKNNKLSIFNRTFKFLTPNDFLVAKLTGKYFTDYFNAQKYHYDMTSKSYPDLLLKNLGIEISSLPDVVSPGTNIGNLNREVSEMFNLKTDVRVIVSSYDAICSFFGSGPTKEGDAVDVSGTVTSFRVLTQKKDLIASKKVLVQSFDELGIKIVGGSNNLGGGLIEWLKDCFYKDESEPYKVLEKEASESEVGASGLIFLPYLLGERFPMWDANARGVFFGIDRTHSRKDMTRSVFESAGFAIKGMIDAIEETGIKVGSIKCSGGLSRFNLISQIKADITGRDIIILDEFETTAIGAAMLVLVGVGEFNDLNDAAKKFVFIRKIFKPNIKNHKKYTTLYMLFNLTYETLKDLFVIRKELVDKLYSETTTILKNL